MIRYLIFVKLAVFKGWFTLRLEGNNDKTDKDIDHEEGDNDDVNKVEDGNIWSVVMQRSNILSIGVDGNVKDPETFSILKFL